MSAHESRRKPKLTLPLKSFDKDIVSGNLMRSVWKLAWPLVLLNLVNGLHGLVDHILIGNFLASADNAANAAIGVAWQVFLVVVVFIASIFHGMNVLIARYAGRQDRAAINRIFYSALLASILILVLLVAPLGYLGAPQLLKVVNVAPEVHEHALPYLRLLFLLGAPLFLMFMLTGAFHASGQPKTPLKLGVLTTALNIIISTVLITGWGPFPALGVIGAALGTVLAPMASCAIGLYLIASRRMIIQFPPRDQIVPDLRLLRTMTRIGVPTGIQGVLLNVAGVVLLRYISELEHSAAAQAAYTICYAQLFSLVSWTSFGLRAAAGTLMGQNIGADKAQRGKTGVMYAAIMGAAWAVIIGIVFWTLPAPLLRLFNAVDEPVYGLGLSLLRYLGLSGVALSMTLALTGGLQGAGATRAPMSIAFATQIVVLLGLCQLFLSMGVLTAHHVWASLFVSHTLRLALTCLVFRTDGWANTLARLDNTP